MFAQFLFAIGFVLLTTAFAGRWGFFQLPPGEGKHASWGFCFKGFSLYILAQVVFIPVLVSLWLIVQNRPVREAELSTIEVAWANTGSIFFSCVLVLLFVWIKRDYLFPVLFNRNKRAFSFFSKGSASWLLAYPAMTLISTVATGLTSLFYQGQLPDQTAVAFLKSAEQYPLVLGVVLFEIIVLVPLTEEILFRGLFQSALRQKLRPWQAIPLSGAVFALFHFASSQGIFNIELIFSLFVLGCYLGFLFEKYKTIWSSVGLHATFNMISVFFILIVE